MKKWIVRIVIGVVVLLVVVFVASAIFLGSIVRKAIVTIGPNVAGAEVRLEAVNVAIFAGGVDLKELFVGNPSGYKTAFAIKAGDVSVSVKPGSIFSDKLIVDKIVVKSPEITFEGGLKDNNLAKLEKNVNDYVGSGANSGVQPGATQAAAKPGRKLQVNELVITGAKLDIKSLYSGGQNITVPLPDIHLTGLGTGPEGITAPQVAQKALSALLESVVKTAGKTIENAAKEITGKKAGELLKGIFGK